MTEIESRGTSVIDHGPGRQPATVSGVEQEYKWRLGETELFGSREPTLELLAAAIPAPRESREVQRFRHTQSTIYFDDDWHLTKQNIALRATVNPGAARDLSWLGVKQTIAWREDGCRDSLEVNERIRPTEMSRVIEEARALPLTYLARLTQRPLTLTPYASVIQDRHKIFYRTEEEWLLQVTFDVAVFRPADGGAEQTSRWLEIENNIPDLRARCELDTWAGELNERFGWEPARAAKSAIAAASAGWTDDR